MRDRRGRGRRGPLALPGPLSPSGVPAQLSRRAQFDAVVLDVVEQLSARWEPELRHIEFGVEDTPLLAADWAPGPVPLATSVPATPVSPARVVVFRFPVEQRAPAPSQQRRLVRGAVIGQLAELLGRTAEEIDPG